MAVNGPEKASVCVGTYGISEAKALNASAKVSTFVIMAAPRPMMATAPSGSGVVMMPTIVPARSSHARAND